MTPCFPAALYSTLLGRFVINDKDGGVVMPVVGRVSAVSWPLLVRVMLLMGALGACSTSPSPSKDRGETNQRDLEAGSNDSALDASPADLRASEQRPAVDGTVAEEGHSLDDSATAGDENAANDGHRLGDLGSGGEGAGDRGGNDQALADSHPDGTSVTDASGELGSDASLIAGCEPGALFALRTVSDGVEFAPSVDKMGDPLRWDLGDGTVVLTKSVSHIYYQVGPKTVCAFSPDGSEGLTRLQSENDALVGGVPLELGALKNLEVLSLANNQLSGEIPHELTQLGRLKELNLSSNQLNGRIPLELGALNWLNVLNLSNNQLDGRIPPELGSLFRLKTLRLSSNQLDGRIPPELRRLNWLLVLDLSNNRLNGTLPPELSSLYVVETLELSNNGLHGNIPASLSQLSELRQLRLSDNGLGIDPAVPPAKDPLGGYESGAFVGLWNIEMILLDGNALSAQAVDTIIADLYSAKGKFAAKPMLDIRGANNPQQLSADTCTKIAQLQSAPYGWEIRYNGSCPP